MKLLSEAVRSVRTLAIATIAGAGLFTTALGAYGVCNLCECHNNHGGCAEDHSNLCGQVGGECFTHEGTLCEFS